jgi:heterodisulfide reductase subunit A
MRNRIGVYVCQCGSNISDYVDVEKVKELVGTIDGVVFGKTTMFACADSTQKEIVADIQEQNLDGIVVASCSPKLHKITFRNVASRAGLNPYQYVQVNIREQGSWPHSDNPKLATEKAIQLVKAGIERVKHSEALEPMKIDSKDTVLVVGGGVAGMRSALELANMGSSVYLVEKTNYLGGRIPQWGEMCSTNERGDSVTERLFKEISNHEGITFYKNAEIESKSGSVGNFVINLKITPSYVNGKIDSGKVNELINVCPVEVENEFDFGLTKRKAIVNNNKGQFPEGMSIDMKNCNKCGECAKIAGEIDLEMKEETITLEVGAILLATGSDPYTPETGEFGYKEMPNVVTMQEFKRLMELNPNRLEYNGKQIKHIGYIYCVGSRQEDGPNQFCSRYCCTTAIHTAMMAKQKYEGIKNFHITRGVRTFGKHEEIYNKSSESGDVYFQFMYTPPELAQEGDKVIISVEDLLTAEQDIEIPVDMVVLVTGMVPSENSKLNDIFKVPIGRDNFYNEIHPKLRPVETVIDGVHIAGTCQSPKTVPESMNSCMSAAIKASSLVSKGYIELEPTLAKIEKSTCTGTGECITMCPYEAISLIDVDGKKVAEVTKANCKGCGMCLPVCPTNSIQLVGYTDVEIEGMIDALLS